MTTPTSSSASVPQWRVSGHVIIACNCDYGCPCNFNGRPSTGKCEGNWNWHVEQGNFGDVALSGITVSVAVNWPGAIHEGNGDGIVVIDERADERQRSALMTLISGQAGGPWKIIRGASAVFRIAGPVSFDHSGRYAAVAPFQYQGP